MAVGVDTTRGFQDVQQAKLYQAIADNHKASSGAIEEISVAFEGLMQMVSKPGNPPVSASRPPLDSEKVTASVFQGPAQVDSGKIDHEDNIERVGTAPHPSSSASLATHIPPMAYGGSADRLGSVITTDSDESPILAKTFSDSTAFGYDFTTIAYTTSTPAAMSVNMSLPHASFSTDGTFDRSRTDNGHISAGLMKSDKAKRG
ncbi:unnamed protein product [Ectocarpus sp. 12 AP-2014]